MRTLPLVLLASLALSAPPSPARAASGRDRSGPYSVELVDEGGSVLPTHRARGRAYVLGALGQRYLVRVRNRSPRRVEVVVSVDGRDVIDGRPSGFGRRGYVVDAYGELTVDGYRLSHASVAAFRFGTVPRSYASRMGDARDVGVVGVAVFPERQRVYGPRAPSHPRALPEEAPSESAPPASPAPGADAGARAEASRPRRSSRRPGLGTEFGEERESHVVEVPFVRARPQPDAVLAIRYDDRAGLLGLGIDVDGGRSAWADERWLRETADPFRRDGGFAEPPPGWRR